MFKRFVSTLFVALLCSCGGGGATQQQVAQVTTASLAYGTKMTIGINGTDLNSGMTITTGACQDAPTFSSASTPSGAIANCVVTATGSQPLTITGSNGQVLYSQTITIPEPEVTLKTSLGTIVLQLDPEVVPVTVNNFLAYVHAKFYDSTIFHRVIAGFVIQGGGFVSGMTQLPTGAPIPLETNKGLSNTRGTIAMARTSDPNSATSQFFINLVNNPSLDYQNPASPGYAVFGTVVQGMDVVDAIGAVATGTVNGYSDVPTTDVTVISAQQTK